ncbi:uncharacterized protein [Prorops nasuta]|uniref:uncharacterized protein isoform X2 n=1 Tax=Prorops nasuta TaxID=863751 RepID=UPI0034CEB57B
MATRTQVLSESQTEKRKKKKQESKSFLPPLTPQLNQNQQPSTPWTRDASCAARSNNRQRRRPYRVLHIGATPLMHACQQADRGRVLRLLKDQEDTIGYRDRTLRSALHYCMDAATSGAVAAAAPELVNAQDAEGHTPLHLAVIAGDTQLVAVLLANGADVNAKDLEGHSVLHWATVCGEAECVRLVLAAGGRPSTPDLRGGSPLHYAAQCCGVAATAELAVPKKVGMKVLQTLLEFGADVNAKDEDGRQPILWAASAGSVEAVLALARAGGSAAAGASDKDGLTALHCAASRGHARCIEALVNLCGSQPDHVDDNGCSALHYAATLGHADATALILKLGADPNRQDRKGRTPALCAAAKGQLETLKILAQHGGSLHARTVRGTGVAHEAVASGRLELLKWLAKKRPGTLDVATQDGKTPLHVAALHGHLDACKVLLDHGVRINALLRTNKGNLMTALDAALYRGHRDCAKLLQMHGGTTAQRLNARNIRPDKIFAAKVRLTRTDSSSSVDSRDKHPDHYHEERWIGGESKKSSKRSTRRGSRSYSEEEIRFSKSSSKRDRERRAKSESSRYDGKENTIGMSRRKPRSKRRFSKCKHDYSETSSGSDSCGQPRDSHFPKVSNPVSDGERESLEGEGRREGSTSDDDNDADSTIVSEDSLEEVVVVKRSMEKKSETVFSGKRSKTPRESSRETRMIRTKRCTKRRTKASRSRSKIEAELADAEKLDEIGKENVEGLGAQKYQRDGTDSTSQEGVERVVVTAMVHKDQSPDTPEQPTTSKLPNTSKDPTITDDTRDKMYDILKKADKLHNDLLTKAADLRKDVEDMKLQVIQEKSQLTEADDQEKHEELLKGKIEMSQVEDSEERTLKEREDTLGEGSTLKSEKSSSRDEDLVDESSGVADGKTDSAGPVTVESSATPSEKKKQGNRTEKSTLTPRTVVEDINVVSDNEGKRAKLTHDEILKSKGKPRTAVVKSSAGTAKTKVGKRASERSSVDRGVGKKKFGATAVKSPVKKSVALVKKEPEGSSLQVLAAEDEKSVRESLDDKEQVDSARGKSVDLSTDSRDSAVLDDGEDASFSFGTPRRKSLADISKAEEELMNFETSGRKSLDDASKLEVGHGATIDFDRRSPKLKSNHAEERETGRFIDESNYGSSPGSGKPRKLSKTSSGKGKKTQRPRSSRSTGSRNIFDSSEDGSPRRSAIVAVIESPEWDDDDEEGEEEEMDKEIRDAIGDNVGPDTEPEENNGFGSAVRIVPTTSDDETPRVGEMAGPTTTVDSLPEVTKKSATRRSSSVHASPEGRRSQLNVKQRRDSGGRDSGIEPSPRVSRIPRRTGSTKCCPISEKQRALNMETITRDVQISMRRYHLERKIFFQLMELKRLQIRHGRANEHVLVKRQVDAFHKAGMYGPLLGVAKYDQPLTFRDFEAFLYEQLRRLQRRSAATPEFCTDAKRCTRKTHRCHHATSAYTAIPCYTYHYNCSWWRRPRPTGSSSEDRESWTGPNDG